MYQLYCRNISWLFKINISFATWYYRQCQTRVRIQTRIECLFESQFQDLPNTLKICIWLKLFEILLLVEPKKWHNYWRARLCRMWSWIAVSPYAWTLWIKHGCSQWKSYLVSFEKASWRDKMLPCFLASTNKKYIIVWVAIWFMEDVLWRYDSCQ